MANQMMGNRVWNKLNQLEIEINNLKSLTIPSATFSTNSVEDQEFMKQFPISNIENIDYCENIIKMITDQLKKNWYYNIICLQGLYTIQYLYCLFCDKSIYLVPLVV